MSEGTTNRKRPNEAFKHTGDAKKGKPEDVKPSPLKQLPRSKVEEAVVDNKE